MAEYVKLFSTILDSSIMDQPVVTRWIWTVILAMKDRDGVVAASVGGLARRAGVSRPEIEQALAAFLAPDPDSRTKDDEGRRIEVIDGGWRVINHQKYRDQESIADRREKDAVRQRRHRGKPASQEPSRDVTPGHESHGIRSDHSRSDQRGESETPPQPATKPPEPTPHDIPAPSWFQRYKAAWWNLKGAQYAGSDSDAKACGQLSDMLRDLSQFERDRANQQIDAIIALFLSDDSPRVVRSGHRFSWFVQDFNALRLKADDAHRDEMAKRRTAKKPGDPPDWWDDPARMQGPPSDFVAERERRRALAAASAAPEGSAGQRTEIGKPSAN